MIPRFRTRFLQIPTAVDVISNRVGPLAHKLINSEMASCNIMACIKIMWFVLACSVL